MKFQIVGYTLGILITITGLAEMIPALIDWRHGHPNAQVFFFNSILCLFFGGALVLANRSHKGEITLRQAFMLTISCWVVMSMFCALPMYMVDLDLSYVDAFFEAVSGITTTGATILPELDERSHGLLAWRSTMQWVGGLGIIAFGTILLPYLKLGGMQVFRSQSSGHSDKVMPRSTEVLMSIFQVYTGITLFCAGVYYYLGMSWFEALNHAMTTISTGGFSTHEQSFAAFNSKALEYACVLFMLMGALPFVLYLRMVFQGRFAFWRDEQVRALVVGLLVAVFFMFFWHWFTNGGSFEESFRHVLFSVVSIVTTTGFVTVDYTQWGGFAVLAFLLMTYIGACAGSTAGGIKTMRLVVAWRVVARQFKTLLYPNGVFVLNYQRRRLNDYTVLTVMGFLSLYVGANVIMTILLAMTGIGFETAISGAATTIANVGPGIGSQIGPFGSYADLPESAKWLLSLGMILGRLEILTVLILFSPTYWQK